jgi:2-C-methyl-D-erythritol 4-phosphate cytidylyltransferase / 2-C-methyl-D-erythritol 2,4-cyclodiphosphate synthase
MNIAIIPAAGSGSRLGGEKPKQFIEIGGAPIIIHTLRSFEACEEIDAIVVALQHADVELFKQRLETYGLTKQIRLVDGGAERSDSIFNALEAAKDWQPVLVIVHDAARPFVTPSQISAVLTRALQDGAAILALPATDTIKEVEDGLILRTIDRRRIYRAQTPQAFRYDLLLAAHARARDEGLSSTLMTDDALLIERLGSPVAIVEGSQQNIKITTPDDLIIAERLLEQMNTQYAGLRIGIGNDIHRLVEGRQLILGGVGIPFQFGLLGHSDGDSLTHAITDALLGAAGLGDIGTHFSDDNPLWLNADSFTFLRHACSLLTDDGYDIANIDATIMAERPKIMPHIPEMRARLAGALGIDHSRINIKAKTSEGLDAVGRGEAIAAQAIVLIRR